VLCRILHSGVLQKCVIIGGVAYESLTLHQNIDARLAGIFASRGREDAKDTPSRERDVPDAGRQVSPRSLRHHLTYPKARSQYWCSLVQNGVI